MLMMEKKTKEFAKRICNGYEIIQAMQVKKTENHVVEVVLGHNPEAAEPYVTWYSVPGEKDYFYQGIYRIDQHEATVDFFRRCLQTTDLDLHMEYWEQDALNDIFYVLENEYGATLAELLLKNASFKKTALKVYDDLDHSPVMDALAENIKSEYKKWIADNKVFDYDSLKSYFEKQCTMEPVEREKLSEMGNGFSVES